MRHKLEWQWATYGSPRNSGLDAPTVVTGNQERADLQPYPCPSPTSSPACLPVGKEEYSEGLTPGRCGQEQTPTGKLPTELPPGSTDSVSLIVLAGWQDHWPYWTEKGWAFIFLSRGVNSVSGGTCETCSGCLSLATPMLGARVWQQSKGTATVSARLASLSLCHFRAYPGLAQQLPHLRVE